jgi:hypothetical protein
VVDVGDALCVRTSGFFSWLIRCGAWLQRKPSSVDHVAIVSRVDPDGTVWVVEAWSTTGVREHNAADYLASPYTVTNAKQPKTPQQRGQIATMAESLLHRGYDWLGIVGDAAQVFRLPDPFVRQWSASEPPKRFVCSSLAAWVYQAAGLVCPTEQRFTSPADWVSCIDEHGWA